MLFGILSINLPKIFGGILDHAVFSRVSSIFMSFDSPIESKSSFKIDHKFSIGLKSGELAGHVPFSQKLFILLLLNQFCVTFAL